MSIIAENPRTEDFSSLRTDLIDLRLEKDRRGRWTRIPVDMKAFIREGVRDQVLKRSARAYESEVILTDSTGKTKYVDYGIGGPWITSGELARVYLDMCLAAAQPNRARGKRRIGFRREELPFFELDSPRFYAGPILEPRRLVLVDLDACHWNLAWPATIDTHFRLIDGGGIRLGDGKVEWLRADDVERRPGGLSKSDRLALTGYLRRRQVDYFRYGQPRSERPNRFMAPGLWGWMMSVLHAMAHEAIENWGVHRMYIDSFLIDEADAEGFIDWLGEVWLMPASVRARGMGCLYQLHWYEIAASKPGDLSKSTKPMSAWRKKSFKDPPVVSEPSSYVISRFPHTRAALASSRRKMILRTVTRGAVWEPDLLWGRASGPSA